MRPVRRDLLVRSLRAGEPLADWDLSRWEELIRQARPANLLARIGSLVEQAGYLDRIPSGPRAHLRSAQNLATRQSADVRREVDHIVRALAHVAVPVTLLKGAAYVMAGHSPARGRMFSDIDILVPKASLSEVEAALMLAGWVTTHHSAYDQRYYRQWMHELPPMQHVHRQTVVDVHHAILPETARSVPDPVKLISSSLPVDGNEKLRVLAPIDMVLHSMSHLFHNDELSQGLRDLSDLDLLLREFGARTGFWIGLVERAEEMDLKRVLHYGLGLTSRLLGAPIPADALACVRGWGPRWPVSELMDAIWFRALRSHHPDVLTPLSRAALFALYLRGHWLRMPPPLLARHLSIKAMHRLIPAQG